MKLCLFISQILSLLLFIKGKIQTEAEASPVYEIKDLSEESKYKEYVERNKNFVLLLYNTESSSECENYQKVMSPVFERLSEMLVNVGFAKLNVDLIHIEQFTSTNSKFPVIVFFSNLIKENEFSVFDQDLDETTLYEFVYNQINKRKENISFENFKHIVSRHKFDGDNLALIIGDKSILEKSKDHFGNLDHYFHSNDPDIKSFFKVRDFDIIIYKIKHNKIESLDDYEKVNLTKEEVDHENHITELVNKFSRPLIEYLDTDQMLNISMEITF